MEIFEDTWSVCNSGLANLAVWLEPSTIEYIVRPRETLRIAGSSSKEGALEVVEYAERIGVYEWPGASIQIFLDDRLVDEWPGFGDGGLPSGASIREFIEMAFGGPGSPFKKPWYRRIRLRTWLFATILVVMGFVSAL